MEKKENRRKHHHLYHIFAADKQKHQMPVQQAEKIREKIFEIFSKNLKPNRHIGPPH